MCSEFQIKYLDKNSLFGFVTYTCLRNFDTDKEINICDESFFFKFLYVLISKNCLVIFQ